MFELSKEHEDFRKAVREFAQITTSRALAAAVRLLPPLLGRRQTTVAAGLATG